MMTIFMEYKVRPEAVSAYEGFMKEIATSLQSSDAQGFRWYEAFDQPRLYVEMYEVENEEVYKKMKRARQTANHPIYGKLSEFIDGGVEKIHCWAFVSKEL